MVPKRAIAGDYEAAYREWGEGPPLLLLHGFFGCGRGWEPVMTHLAPHFRCVALDLLGFGDSAKPDIAYHIDEAAAFVRDFIGALGWGSVPVVGYSYGGWVAASLAIQHSPLVSKLALVAPAGIRDDDFVGRYDGLRPLLWRSPVVDGVLAIARRVWPGSPQVQQICEFRTALQTQPVARALLCRRLRPEDAIDTVEGQLHRIQVPTLVIAAEGDHTIPRWHCETYAQGIAAARLQVVPNADHDLLQTHAAVVAQALCEALTRP
ncbi:MAG: alpha/beta hydrolase [Oscillatoriales cyanobacterium SM2_1_8]|nr:alpha/beta hydrolase [Oscillatoriales cyanobacterium SM2_1_8]